MNQFQSCSPAYLFPRSSISYSGLEESMLDLFPKLIAIAKQKGDFYFEMHSASVTEHKWVVTQVAEHRWSVVNPPEGETIFEANGIGNVISSGVVYPTNSLYVNLGISASLAGRWEENLALVKTTRDSLVAGSEPLIGHVEYMLPQAAVIEPLAAHGRRRVASHTKGVYREAGIIVLGSPNNHHSFSIVEQVNGKPFAVWGDELHGKGGVVLLK